MRPIPNDTENSGNDDTSESKIGRQEGKDMVKPKVVKKMVRVLSPTSEQLASLNLKEGRNTITFTFFTPMLGKQQVFHNDLTWVFEFDLLSLFLTGYFFFFCCYHYYHCFLFSCVLNRLMPAFIFGNGTLV